MNRIPPQYDYCNTADEPWLSDNMPFTNESSSGSGELYSTFTTPVTPIEQLPCLNTTKLLDKLNEQYVRERKKFDYTLPSSRSMSFTDVDSLHPLSAHSKLPPEQSLKKRSWFFLAWITSLDFIIEPQSFCYVTWLSLVTMCYLYNCWIIPLRITFPYQTSENLWKWMLLDYCTDAINLLDTFVIKPRIIYLKDGFWVRDLKLIEVNYLEKLQSKLDILSLIPADLLCLSPAFAWELLPLMRLNRIIKIQTFWEFFDHFDSVLSSPYVVRVTRTLTYMVYLVHMNACAYYYVSVKEGLATNNWVFNGQGNAYIRCFFFATKTATSIGKNPHPENEVEYLFMTASWLMGVFVFAILIGQIRDIIATATRSQTEYRKLQDETLEYLRKLNIPPRIRARVEQWFSFTWEQQRTLDENRILDSLPHKMKTDVAINVHMKTLNKVQLFKDCDKALLRELVLKLRPILYLPGDYICRKGEVGKEMYIVKTGQVQVVGGEVDDEVLATLTEGSVFGEISLLSLCGTNRRTADVRSHGFSNIFVLSKEDLNEAIKFYPNAQEILKRKARELIQQNAVREHRQIPTELLDDHYGNSTDSLMRVL
ncbi:Cyclic nucleotide-binding, conserved site,Ion transport domain,RmlC-like jelly roll fold,Cyclic [Cinara cedri]|uniref:Cyclic nucleotide-binding, conserved site,Ion transport domain,RmlC-like jelly roll fold,Cyclic n=1 Tax=Cinara cedri TaxID=506608 RepID=A0A5E4MZ41_9HEMI|nr:Cyclic nucleotide-binding, conserved site,Ion transport domain,RmlC-like jelly roll fold,Cyclic [Cinara cedri]